MINPKESLISCSKCKSRVPLNDLKADKEGKKWICTSCYSVQHPNMPKTARTERDFTTPKLENSDRKFRYQCTGCKYIFTRNFEFKGMCPYCSKEDTVVTLKIL